MSESTLPRQTGEDRENTRPCPNCGQSLAVVQRDSGSLTTENCESCWSSTPVEQAAEAEPQVPVLTGLTDLSQPSYVENSDGED